ncbi:hypothetical protein BC832DRAFT_618517 [Gaertneriomyces semiglobifer]|nr:hypothetical protein BC832DRAFT_618517 [Gaertneriomyces semiglobifer]
MSSIVWARPDHAARNSADIKVSVLLDGTVARIAEHDACCVRYDQDANVTTLKLRFSCDKKKVTVKELREHVHGLYRAYLPTVYVDNPDELPLVIVPVEVMDNEEHFFKGRNASNSLTLEYAEARLVGPGDVNLGLGFLWDRFDFTDEGDVSYHQLIRTTFAPSLTRVKPESSAKSATGRCPTSVRRWTDFYDAVNRYNGPAQTALHRSMYPTISDHPQKYTGSESEVEALLDNEAFLLVNELTMGCDIEIGSRQFVHRGVIGQPDRVIHNCLSPLVPIEVESSSVLPDDADIVSLCQEALQTLSKLPDQRYSKLSAEDQHTWDIAVRDNMAAKVLIQIIGYACVNKLRYAILTTHRAWWFLERLPSELGAVRVAGPIHARNRDPTVGQCLDYMLSLALASPSCPSPSALRTSSPPRRGRGGARGDSNPGLGTIAGGVAKRSFTNYRLDADAAKSRKAFDANAVVRRDSGEVEFTENDVLPRLYPALSQSTRSSVYPITVFHEASITMALKVVDCYKVEDDDVKDELMNELDAYEYLPELQGSVIPQLRAFGNWYGGAFLVLGSELIEGKDLCAEHQDMFGEVRRAFMKLHDAGIVHGDVACRNTLVTRDPARPIVLIDFGRANEATNVAIARELGSLDRLFDSLRS